MKELKLSQIGHRTAFPLPSITPAPRLCPQWTPTWLLLTPSSLTPPPPCSTVEVAKDKIEYYADLIYNAMQGAGTDDKTLIRLILSRSELDLGDIKEKYLEKYGKTIDHSIEVSGGRSLDGSIYVRGEVTGRVHLCERGGHWTGKFM